MAAPVPVIISRALEMFAETLLGSAKRVTSQRGARTLTPSHLKFCIQSEARFDFLRDLVSGVPDLQGEADLAEPTPATSSVVVTGGASQPARGRGAPTRGVRGATTGRRRGRPPKTHNPSAIPGAIPKKTVAEKLFIDDVYDCENKEDEEEDAEEEEQPVQTNGWASRLAPAPSAAHNYARSLSVPHPGHHGHPGHLGHPGLSGHPSHPGHPGHPGHLGHPGHPGHPKVFRQHSYSSPYDIQRSTSINNQDYYLHFGAYRGGHHPASPAPRASSYARPILPRPPPTPSTTAHTPLTTAPPPPVPGLTAFYKEREEEAHPHGTNGTFRIGPVGGEGEKLAREAAATELTKMLVPGPAAGGGQAADEDYDC